MKFINYLNEEFDGSKIFEILNNDCSEFLKDFKPNIKLFRGMKEFEPFFKNIVIKNRNPMDTSKILHDVYDKIFYKKFNKKLRSESVFCSPNINVAESYGPLYVIFPKGNYKMYSSKYIKDLYITINQPLYNSCIQNVHEKVDRDFVDMILYFKYISGKIHIIAQDFLSINEKFNLVEISEKDKSSDNLYDIIRSYLVNHIIPNKDRWEKHLGNLYKEIYYKDLKGWDNEVMLICDEYYALKYEKFYDVFKSF